MINGQVSFWWSQVERRPARAPLPGPLEVDVCVVGAGYTGLWTAYYLKKAAPHLDIAVVEQRFAGFGASGRNGGWLTNEITGGVAGYLTEHGPEVVDRLQGAMNDTVDEVIRVAAVEGVDADIRKGGEFAVARGPAQLDRLRQAYVSMAGRRGTEVHWFDAAEARDRIDIAGTTAGMWHPHCARIHPAKLAGGLARVVESLGVRIFEDTRVTAIEPRLARTDRGDVTARHVLRATEGFTADIAGLHRSWLPMNSSMIVTERIPESTWREIGWADYDTLGDTAHAYMYAQRTEDGRVAIGGRGKPYRFGSRVDAEGETPPETVAGLRGVLEDMLPTLRGVGIDHTWSGVLGVPRDWKATVGLDRETGLGWAGGYVGTGVTATNLAARTLRDLVLGQRTELTSLPWVDHRVRNWEVEPLRYLAVSTLYGLYRVADAQEAAGRTSTSPLARLADLVSGRGH